MAQGPNTTGRRSLGRPFTWLWSAYAISTLGTYFAFNAFSLILIRILHAGPAQVAALSASGAAVGALIALPLGPWVEYRRKRPVMMAMDLMRFAAMLTIPIAFGLGVLSFAQLLAVAIVVGAADITFTAASGAYLKALLPREDLLTANGRFESTQWSAIVLGPPLGGAAFALLGPVATVVADAASYLLSALGIRAIGAGRETTLRLPTARPPRVKLVLRLTTAQPLCLRPATGPATAPPASAPPISSPAGAISSATRPCAPCFSTMPWSVA